MKDLLVVVPTRSRPQNVRPVAEAWAATGAYEVAELMFVADADDPALDAYLDAAAEASLEFNRPVITQVAPRWQPLVPKLNDAVRLDVEFNRNRFAVAFAGDDHLPRTLGWAEAMLDALREMGTGIVYPDDGYQGENLPTSWAMTADIVRLLDGMIPAPVEHLFCDNSLRDLGRAAGCLRYLPEVLVEHMHPVAGKRVSDDQYKRVNGRDQWRRDKRVYREWQAAGLPDQASRLRALVAGERP